MTREVTRLNSGLTIASDAMPDFGSTAIGIWVNVGARHELKSENGLSHMLEHMAFKGTGRRTALQIAEEIEAVGGQLNAYTSRDQTCFYARVLKDDVPLAMDILSDILTDPTFEQDELERERHVILQEIGQAYDTPDDIVFDNLQEAAFPDQAMGRPILGPKDQVANYTSDDLRRYMGRHYQAPSMIVAAAGAVDHDALVAMAREKLASIGDKPGEETEVASYTPTAIHDRRDAEQLHLTLALPGITYQDPDYYAWQVAVGVLGGGMSSRLFQEVREKRGLAYSVYAFAAPSTEAGLTGIYTGTAPEAAEDLATLLGQEVAKLASQAGAEEVGRAAASLKASLIMGMESPASRAEALARQLSIYGRPKDVQDIADAVDAVTSEQVSAVMDRVIKAGDAAFATVGPLADPTNICDLFRTSVQAG